MAYTTEDVVALAVSMAQRAGKDALEAEQGDCFEAARYWEGWEDGLRTLERHVRTSVKVSCFPVGSCSCHPFSISRPGGKGRGD